MNMSKVNGVKKSKREVVKGIKKLLGSFPFLNKNIEEVKRKTNITPKSNKTVIMMIITMKKGFIICIPVISPILYPSIIKAIMLNKIVIKRPKKSSFNLSDF